MEYNPKVLLEDLRGRTWYAEKHVEFNLPGTPRRRIKGSFRSTSCSLVSRGSEAFHHFMCNACAGIPRELDFRRRLERRDEETPLSARARHDQMPDDVARAALARISREKERLRRNCFFLCSKLAATNVRLRAWRDRVKDTARRGELKRVTDELTKAYDDGKFQEKRALWAFIKDLVHSTHLASGDGQRSRGMKWSESTNRFFAVIRKFGGPRTQKFFYDNIGGPH